MILSILSAAVVALSPVAPDKTLDAAETALRCNVPTDAPFFLRSPGAVSSVRRGAETITRSGSPLPEVMVDGWRPAPGPLSTVLSQLGHEAGFMVVGAEGLPSVSWSGGSAPLSKVMDDLTRQAGASWTFAGGVVHVSKGPPPSVVAASLSLPKDRDVTLALLDTLRGLDARDVAVAGDAIAFRSSGQTIGRVQNGLSGIADVYAFDVTFLEGRPTAGRYEWTTFPGGIASGRAEFGDDGEVGIEKALRAVGDLRTDGTQTVAGPAGWAVVVPQSQCGKGSSEVTLRPKRVGDGFSLQISGSGFDTSIPTMVLGDTILVQARDAAGSPIRLMAIRPRIVSVR